MHEPVLRRCDQCENDLSALVFFYEHGYGDKKVQELEMQTYRSTLATKADFLFDPVEGVSSLNWASKVCYFRGNFARKR